MRCTKHFHAIHVRLKQEATEQAHPGQWFCTLCHAPTQQLLDYGHLEFSDRRETLPYRPLPRATPADILRGLAAQRKASTLRRGSSLGAVQKPAGTPSASASLKPIGTTTEDLEENVYAGTSGQLQKTNTPATPPPTPKVFIDAANIDLDDPEALGREAKPRAKAKPKAKAKPRAKAKKATPQDQGLF